MNKATYTQILNQRLISYARAHGCMAYPESGDGRVGVIIELPWYIPGTLQQGIDYAYVKTFADLRKELGY
jgi:hypothetical protein